MTETYARERAVAFVVVRLSSSRLPRKQLREIGGQSIIARIMASLAQCAELDEVVLATVAEPDNEPLRPLAVRFGWPLFWFEGEVDDVVGRLTSAARAYEADICLLISADCPLVHATSIDEAVARFRACHDDDYVSLVPDEQGRSCLLEGVQIARRSAWELADTLSDRPELREHQFPVIGRHPERFRRRDLVLRQPVYGAPHRLSVDTVADIEFMTAIYDRLAAKGLSFDLPNAVELLARQPDLKEVNRHVHQRAVVEDLRQVLVVVDAGGEYGFGHLMRCLELGAQIVERLSWPVTFVIDDDQAQAIAGEAGFRIIEGALGRPARNKLGTVAFPEIAFDIAIVDISVRRELQPGWRPATFPETRVVVIDRGDRMASEADQVVFPGVCGRPLSETVARTPVMQGLGYVILRREIRELQRRALPKDVDLMVYVYDEVQRSDTLAVANALGWRCDVVTGFAPDFAERLARARVFISGYGNAFYEAIALGTLPVAWPLSDNHEQDALAFFSALDVPPQIVTNRDTLSETLGPLQRNGLPTMPTLTDGTPAVVEALRVAVAGVDLDVADRPAEGI